MYTILYFSPTGNAKHLALKLAKSLGVNKDEILPLEFTDAESLKFNRHLVLFYPVHAFNAPRTVKRFVRLLPPGLFEAGSLINVGFAGNWLNDTVSDDLRRPLERKGYSVILDETLPMPLTFIMNSPRELKIIARLVASVGPVVLKRISNKKVTGNRASDSTASCVCDAFTIVRSRQSVPESQNSYP